MSFLFTVVLACVSLLHPTRAVIVPQQISQSTSTPGSTATKEPTQDYLVYVVCESADRVVLVRFGPKGATLEHETRIGLMPMDINGPHGIAISPDKQYV